MRSAANLQLVRGLVPAETVLSRERTLPVAPGLSSVVPSGVLQRGSTVAVHGAGATSFALAVAGQAIRDGSFLAIVAPESFALSSCLDFDIPLRRVVQFVLGPTSGTDEKKSADKWAQAVAAIIEGFDIVLIVDEHKVRASQARQLTARNRERGSVILRVGGPSWPEAADLRFDVGSPAWFGLGQGHGHLQQRRVTVQVAGRRYHGRSRSHELMLPALNGGVTLAATASDQRWAGSDIDTMLDIVYKDRVYEGTADEGTADESKVDGGGVDGGQAEAVVDFDAIA